VNYAEAYKWLTLSANKRNHLGAASMRSLDELKHIMTEFQLRDGKARVSEWTSHAHINLAVRKTETDALDGYATAASALP
jgi:hypothetical protein